MQQAWNTACLPPLVTMSAGRPRNRVTQGLSGDGFALGGAAAGV